MKIMFVSLTILFLILTILLGTNTIKIKEEWSFILYTYKPSDKQRKYLHKHAEQNNYNGSILTSLYNNLKKTKRIKL